MVDFRMNKIKQYSRPHFTRVMWTFGLEDGSTMVATFLPLCMSDEGLGAPASYNANREHASFAEYNGPNCYPESTVSNFHSSLEFIMSKAALETDKLHAIRVGFLPVFGAFLDTWDAKDELTGDTVKSVLELQHESTDRQVYPIYNGTDVSPFFTGSEDFGTDVPGLTTDNDLEFITFNIDAFYQAIRYYGIADLIKKHTGGLNWLTLTKDRPMKRVSIKPRSAAKRQNPYSMLGVIVLVPGVNTSYQIPSGTDTTAIKHVNVTSITKFDEWNPGFDMDRA